jgi:hypothetical protein
VVPVGLAVSVTIPLLCLQEEIATIFLYTVQPALLAQLSAADLDAQYRLLSDRVLGTSAGPLLNRSVREWELEQLEATELLATDALQEPKAVAAADSLLQLHATEGKDGTEGTQETEMAVDGATESAPHADNRNAGQAVATEHTANGSGDANLEGTDATADIDALLAEVSGGAATGTGVTATAPMTVDLTQPAPVIELSSDTASGTSDAGPAATTAVARARTTVPPKPDQPSLMLCPMVSREIS